VERSTEVLVVGAGLGGVAAALAAAQAGAWVLLVEGDRWLGGQLTAQAVPPDEHPWSEQFGLTATYRCLREGIRAYYRAHYPLTAAARRHRRLNPGGGLVSPLCHEPRVAVAVIEAMLAPYRSSGRIEVLQPYRAVGVDADGDRINAVHLMPEWSDRPAITVTAAYVIDATETGELLPLSGTEYVTGFESRADTGEPSAPDTAQPLNMQAASWCFAMEHVDGSHVKIAVQIESGINGGRTIIAAGRTHIAHAFRAIDGLLQQRGHAGFHRLRVCPGIKSAHAHRWRRQVGILRYRQRGNTYCSAKHNQQRAYCGENRPANEEVDHEESCTFTADQCRSTRIKKMLFAISSNESRWEATAA